jgi:hypothetical protein
MLGSVRAARTRTYSAGVETRGVTKRSRRSDPLAPGVQGCEEGPEARKAATAQEQRRASSLPQAATRQLRGAVAVHVRHDDHQIAAIDEVFEGPRSASAHLAVVEEHVVAGACSQAIVERPSSLQSTDETDPHSHSPFLAVMPGPVRVDAQDVRYSGLSRSGQDPLDERRAINEYFCKRTADRRPAATG